MIAAGGLALLVPRAQAAEQVTLSNGFAMLCDHHARVDGRLRLYMGAGENNYIDLQPDEIKGFEGVPDPNPQTALAARQETRADAKLSPADLHEMLTEASSEHNLDVDLLASVVKAESGGNARAVSRAGAEGLMQLMPSTAAGLGVEDSFKPSENVRGGSTYLDALLTQYHDNLALALAAYNAGPAAVARYNGIPPYHETRAYVARVIHEFNRRVLARRGEETRHSGLAHEVPARRGFAPTPAPQVQ
ncbi:MAG: lytic transglycosylase domain-containing protein [Terracidiphilus sp.]